ncbi:MAG: cysteine hydrolase [Patescibacteria group bacterium]|nr:cysteine hydrolase [Patescibacteria group bacterium]
MPQSNTALVLIGLQELRRDRKSDYYLRNMEPLIERTLYLIDYAREMGYKIIFIRHLEKEGEFSKDSELSQIISDFEIQETDTIIEKYTISSFLHTNLEQELEGIENLVVAGMPTNLCVRMFVEEAYDRAFNIALIEDLCQTYNDKLQDFTLDDLNESRPDIDIIRLEKFID